MVTVTYKVGSTEMSQSFAFDYAIDSDTFAKAIQGTVTAFNQARQGSNVMTATDKVKEGVEKAKTVSVTPKKTIKTAPVEVEFIQTPSLTEESATPVAA